MHPKKEYIYYYTNDSKNLYKSLRRFFNYLLHQKLSSLNEQELPMSNQVIFFRRDERENPELLKIIIQSNIKTLTLGFDNDSSVNLVDIANLKENFLKVISQGKLYYKELFSEEELKAKLKNFFHSHGEDSLFEYLNWTYYFLSNGPEQFIKNEITYEEYQTNFLSPGLKNWDLFISRFHKYRGIIQLCNYKATLNELENAINEADSYVNMLSGLTSKNLIESKINFFKENVEKFKRIDDILGTFYRKLSFEGSPLQNTSGG